MSGHIGHWEASCGGGWLNTSLCTGQVGCVSAVIEHIISCRFTVWWSLLPAPTSVTVADNRSSVHCADCSCVDRRLVWPYWTLRCRPWSGHGTQNRLDGLYISVMRHITSCQFTVWWPSTEADSQSSVHCAVMSTVFMTGHIRREQTMSHTVDMRPLTEFEGGLQLVHEFRVAGINSDYSIHKWNEILDVEMQAMEVGWSKTSGCTGQFGWTSVLWNILSVDSLQCGEASFHHPPPQLFGEHR